MYLYPNGLAGKFDYATLETNKYKTIYFSCTIIGNSPSYSEIDYAKITLMIFEKAIK